MSVCLFICSMDSCEEQCPHHTTCWLSPHCRANSHLQYVMTCWPDLFPKLLVAFCFCWYSNFSTSAKHNNLFCNISTLIFLHWQWFHKCTWNRWTDALFETVVCLGNNKAGCSGTVWLWLTGVWACPPTPTHPPTNTHTAVLAATLQLISTHPTPPLTKFGCVVCRKWWRWQLAVNHYLSHKISLDIRKHYITVFFCSFFFLSKELTGLKLRSAVSQ